MKPVRASLPLIAAVLLAAGGTAMADAPDPVHGRELHDRHCIDCHTDVMGGEPTAIYDRADQHITSLDELYEQVGRCRNSYGEAWPRSWIEDVTTWLNGQFYHFGPLDPARDDPDDGPESPRNE